MDNQPIICLSGSAFNGNSLQATRPITSFSQRNKTNYVSLSDWCLGNNITKRVGYILIRRKLLIAQKLWGQWWVTSNPDCIEELLEYLDIEQLFFDVDN